MPAFTGLPLHSARLLLRPPVAADADALLAIFGHPEAMRYWSTPPWTHLDQATARIEADLQHIAAGAAIRLVLQPLAGGPVIGAVTLFGFVGDSRRAETGYILHRSAWGQGFAMEAMHRLLSYGLSELGLRRVEADIDPRNARSARLLERLGFVLEGRLRERWEVAGEVSDTALYGLLASDGLKSPVAAGTA